MLRSDASVFTDTDEHLIAPTPEADPVWTLQTGTPLTSAQAPLRFRSRCHEAAERRGVYP